MEQYQYIVFVVLCGLSAASIFYAIFYTYFSNSAQAEQRRLRFERPLSKSAVDRTAEQNKRRQQITESLKEVDGSKKQQVTLEAKISQAGLQTSVQTYYIISVCFGIFIALALYVIKGSVPIAGIGGVLAGFFGPQFFLNMLLQRRLKSFLNEFPTAVEVIVRGVKAGLPVGQCISIVANEVNEPVRSEFKKVVEAQLLGLSVAESIARMPERTPLSEVSFFSIVIMLQSKSGGNLAEALGNLSHVLRERKIMKQKIMAMSSEVRMTSYIVSAMPFLIAAGIYSTSPEYMSLLFFHPTGHSVLLFCAFWMGIGIFVFKKMSNFEY